MDIKELKEIISWLPDDMTVEIDVFRKLSDGELSTMTGYVYPMVSERCQISKKEMDVGWAENKVKFNVEVKELIVNPPTPTVNT